MTTIQSFLYPISAAIIAGLLAKLTNCENPVIIGIASFSFAIVSKAFDLFRIGKLEKMIDIEKKLVHRDYALKKISMLRSLANKRSKESIVNSCNDLETILNKMSKCCEEGCQECVAFKTWKGIIGNHKTQIETTFDNSVLIEKYLALVKTLQFIKTLIEEL